jgi:hypothetical protein
VTPGREPVTSTSGPSMHPVGAPSPNPHGAEHSGVGESSHLLPNCVARKPLLFYFLRNVDFPGEA